MKTKWYKIPLSLLLVMCLALSGLPMMVLADGPANMPSLGYSLTGIDNPTGSIHYSKGSTAELPITFSGTQPDATQLGNDGVTVNFVGIGHDFDSFEDWESYFSADFADDGRAVVIKLNDHVYTNYFEESDPYSEIYFSLVVNVGDDVVYSTSPMTLYMGHKNVEPVNSSNNGSKFDVDNWTLIRATEDVKDIEFVVDVSSVKLAVKADLEKDTNYLFADIQWLTTDDILTEDIPDWDSRNIVGAIDVDTVNLNDPSFLYRIEASDKMIVYDADFNRLGETSDSEYKLPYSSYYHLAPNGGGTTITPPTSGGGSGGSGRGGSSSSGGRNTPDGTNNSTTTTAASRSNNVTASGAVNQSQVASEVSQAVAAASGNVATVQTRNAVSISPATLRAMAQAAGDKTIVLHADTLSDNGRAVQGRLYVEPEKLTGLSSDLLLGIKTDNKSTSAVKNHFSQYYDNTVEVVHCEKSGSFGATLQIAAKVNLSKLNTSNLVFYSYDKGNNTFTRIAAPNYTIDSNGYLHFHTERAGDIIITDSPLSSK